MRFQVPDMSCGRCTAAITKETNALDTLAKVTIDLETRTVKVKTERPSTAVIHAIKAAGYASAPV